MGKFSEPMLSWRVVWEGKSRGRKSEEEDEEKGEMSLKKQGNTESTSPINCISGILRKSESNQSSQFTNPKGFFTA